MVTQLEQAAPTLTGTGAVRADAERLFAAVAVHGHYMSADAPIRVSLESLVAFFARTGDDGTAITEERILAAVAANPGVFGIEEAGDLRLVATTRSGRALTAERPASSHSFAKRLMTPLPKPENPLPPQRERVRVDPSWASLASQLGDLAMDDDEDDETEAIGVEAESPAMAPVEVFVEPALAAEVASPDQVEEPVAEPVVARTIVVPAAPSTSDVSEVDDRELATALSERLRADPRIANFGEQWMVEDRVPRFSRGDLRRMKEYIQEQEQPLTDDVLVQDVLSVRPGTPEFDLLRFAVNFRLSREHREFDFVGTTNQRFWSTSSLPQIGTSRRKPNEIGTDYRFLSEELPAEPEYRTVASVDHVVTFYEYYHGLLPYDARMQALLPAPLLPDQRSVVLTFETPQSYTTYLVELRYPTPNRGGFILGLDDFFSENLVPGALISINRTDNDGHYTVEYLSGGNQSARLLELDERRALRYVFRPISFACGVEDELTLTEERYPRLGGEKPLDEKVRRRPEAVVAATFERIGDQSETPGFSASFSSLLAAVNIERPFSERLLRSILDNDDTGAFARDTDGTDAYTYVRGTTS